MSTEPEAPSAIETVLPDEGASADELVVALEAIDDLRRDADAFVKRAREEKKRIQELLIEQLGSPDDGVVALSPTGRQYVAVWNRKETLDEDAVLAHAELLESIGLDHGQLVQKFPTMSQIRKSAADLRGAGLHLGDLMRFGEREIKLRSTKAKTG